MKPISKAQQLRDKQLAQTLTNKLSRVLVDFKDKYLSDYRDFCFEQQIVVKTQYETRLKSPDLEDIAKKRRFASVEDLKKSLQFNISKIEKRLARTALFDLEKYSEADKSFQAKFDNLIKKLVAEQISTRFLKVEKIGGGTYDKFSILISNSEVEIEARFIYACGEIKAPHYRFIITKRNKK